MVNMTVVVDKKEVFNYGIKVFILIIILFLVSKTIHIGKTKENLFDISKIIDKDKLLFCIEDNLHISKLVNNKKTNDNEKIDPLKTIIESQLAVIGKVKIDEKKVEEKKNSEITKVQENEKEEVKHAEVGVETQVLENNVPENFTNSFENVQIKNGTDYELTDEMLTPNVEINNRNVIIFHTHTCESYTPSETYNYEETGTFRTTDLNYSVARVGDELDKQLTSYGFNVIHDTTYHDYPAYNGSYGRSQETVEEILKENSNIDIIIDLHRDAIGDYSYAPTVKIGDDYASQLMFVIGTDGGGLEHPNWEQNLKFAIKVQEKSNELYPRII